jgi:ABC-type multidrug transport system fused ATPase/permease subunit
MKKQLNKLNHLIDNSFKKELLQLLFYLLLAMIFEMFGLGAILPVLSILTNSNIVNENQYIKILSDILGGPTHNKLIIYVFIILSIIYLLKAIFILFVNWKQAGVNAKITSNLAEKLFWGYLKAPYTFHLQSNSATLLRNVQSEVSMINAYIQSILYILTELTTMIGIFIILFLFEPIGAISVTVVLFLFSFIFFKLTKKKIQKWGEERQKLSGSTTQFIMQGLGGIRDVKILGNESYFYDLFSNENNKIANNITKVKTLEQAPRLFLELLAILALATLITLMIYIGRPISLILPTLGIFVASAFRLIPSVNKIMGSLQVISYSKPSIDRVYEELIYVRAYGNRNSSQIFMKQVFKESISLRDIYYSYPSSKNEVIKGITLNISKGDSVGIIGESGSGKSTLIDLLTGLLNPSKGEILIDKSPLNNQKFSWQKNIGYVPQNIYLTDDSLINNIAFGVLKKDICYDSLYSAIKMAQLEKLIDDLPDGLDTFVGERGVRLSGGQRQRIGIARALYNNPDILILDEATSALDNDTEKEVMGCINELHGIKTLIIIAHRYSTVKNCDIIFKLREGSIVSQGTPQQILNL